MKSNVLSRKLIPRTSFQKNGVVHLMLLLGTCYIIFHALKVILIIASPNPQSIEAMMWPYVALGPVQEWLHKPWTILSYSLVEARILTMVTNLFWIYFFGSVLQTLIGYKEVFPLFIFSTVGTGIVFIISSIWLPISSDFFLRGGSLGIIAIGAAALIIAPKYRHHISEHFSFPLWIPFIIFLTLNVFLAQSETIYYILVAISGLLAWTYTRMVSNGFRLGDKWYGGISRIYNSFDKDERKPESGIKNQILNHQGAALKAKEKQLNELLDKIHQKGMSSLSAKELEILEKLSQDI